ncbi:hypothetical protein EDB86DRAFT_2832174 [Lactarius hatsudake]|nr:hypothetical protein EDB86DRAFT_2832174 [Lactarius hatsudake]
MVARPSASSSRGRLAPLLRRGHVVVAPWSCLSRRGRTVVVASLSHHLRAIGSRRASSRATCTTGMPHAACIVAWGSHRSGGGGGGGGLRSESTCGSGVGGGCRWGRWGSRWALLGRGHTRLRRKKRVWQRLNLRRGKRSLDTSTCRAPFFSNYLNASSFNINTTELVLPLNAGHPLYSRDNTAAGTQSTTLPRPVPWPPHHPTRCWALAHYIKIHPSSPHRRLRLHLAAHKPVAAASNSSPRTSPPPLPPPTARKRRHNATPHSVQSAATTPTTTATRSMTTTSRRATVAVKWRATVTVTRRVAATVTRRTTVIAEGDGDAAAVMTRRRETTAARATTAVTWRKWRRQRASLY